jgi:hypothetical protein
MGVASFAETEFGSPVPFEIQTTSPQRHPALTSALQPVRIVRIPAVVEVVHNGIEKMT